MIEIKLNRIISQDDDIGKEAIQIYETAFPIEEKRPIEKHIMLMRENPLFRFYAAMKDKEVIGMMVLWKLDGFTYIDYLAVSQDYRNKGYGKLIIKQLQQCCHSLIVLEVEMPDNDLARRRIRFYTQLGFNLLDFPYFMPKYNNPKEPFQMRLMSFPNIIDDNMCEYVIRQIHSNAYKLFVNHTKYCTFAPNLIKKFTVVR
ncbi:MAG: GNAT family N-acetyltransferase [Bacteroidales bacterium]|jgi:ribosomal protein S18 acetylase RimI-like enzyme|nr:GNAT family N-acetyltransferase [Bacteroidales bacterium]